MKRTMLQTLFVLVLGTGLGCLAAVGWLDSPRSALAAREPESRSSQASAGPSGKACGTAGMTRAGLLSLATTAVQPGSATAAGGGKKPNIVIIWGDDIGQSN